MVQESGSKTNVFSAVSRKDTGNVLDMAAKKGSQMGMKQYDSSKSYSSANKTDNSAQKYGAWGPVYKNKDNFVNMHLF